MTQFQKKCVLLSTLFAGSILVMACSTVDSSQANNEAFSIVKELSLPAVLEETSGLYCPQDTRIFSVNDSGNLAIVYELNDNGKIVNEKTVNAKNNDWEAINGDENYFYIGDIGNNAGKRKHVNIIKLAKTGSDTQIIRVAYNNNSIENNEYIKHDFDAEALVPMGEHLLLFSKSWQTNKLQVYKVDLSVEQQSLSPIATVEEIPGVVTGVDYNKETDQFVIVGYSLSSLGMFSSFIAQLNRDFDILNIYPLKGFHQVEGVCVSPNGSVWFSQEKTVLSSSKLVKLKFND